MVRGPPHAEYASGDFLQRFDAESFEEHLKERRNRAQQNAIEFSFDDVSAAELVQVQADDVEDAVRNQREAVEEQHFFEAPSRKLRKFLEQHHHEAQRKDRGGEAGRQADEEIAAIADAHFGILRKVIEEQPEMPLRGVEEADDARLFRDGGWCWHVFRSAGVPPAGLDWHSMKNAGETPAYRQAGRRYELPPVNCDFLRGSLPPHVREP